jgi:hypothetical protein
LFLSKTIGVQARRSLAVRWFLTRIIFNPEDGGDIFFRNVGPHTDYGAISQRMAT